MKKILLVLITVLMLAGCSSKPDDVRDEVYNAGVKALEIIDGYIDFEITKEDAHDEIDDIHDRVEALYVEKKYDTMEEFSYNETHIKFSINSIGRSVSIGSRDSVEKTIKHRNDLAEELNKKAR